MRFLGKRVVLAVGSALLMAQVIAVPSALALNEPAAPARPIAVGGNTTAKVTWVAPANNGSAIDAYTVTPYIGAVAGTPRPFASTAITQTITGLVNATTYTFKVKAHNANGYGVDSLASFPVTVGAPVAPAAPVIAPGSTTARVTWVAPVNNGSAIDTYTVTPFIGLVAQPTRVYAATAVTQVVTGLTNGTAYTFRVKAHNIRGTSPNSVGSLATIVGSPTVPTAVKASPGKALARVYWTASFGNGSAITSYLVTPYIGTVAQAPRTFTSASVSRDITGLINGTTYKFKVAAVNARGTGPISVFTSAVTPSAQPTLRAVMNTTIGQPILVDANGMTVYEYFPDGANTTSAVNGTLRAIWPYVSWSGAVTVGAGLTLANAVANTQPDTTKLISYNGHLLYTFITDKVPGDAKGQGVAQFFVLDANGNKIP